MESKDRQISFICPNFSSHYRPGELILPVVFYVEHGKYVWSGTVVDGGKKIEGLEALFSLCYRTHVFQYEHCPSSDLLYNKIELAMFSFVFTYNAIDNFSGVYHLVIENKHLVGAKMLPVLSSYACHQLSLDESCKTLKLGFEKYFWNISVDFKNGSLYFGDGWIDFLDALCVMAGDSLSFCLNTLEIVLKIIAIPASRYQLCSGSWNTSQVDNLYIIQDNSNHSKSPLKMIYQRDFSNTPFVTL
ncbi:hypothetical protein POM88_010484 [Heracleum sosnowskyi]|uniref:TF-B3 domain-containing protein n=1 Tax=Heracleum sosnowskyi TaxID=360622 RepID=A0AAD8N1J3_9APIA|nr:hypothetical protein POM88_010484 [Heracleum sosnowskyi]